MSSRPAQGADRNPTIKQNEEKEKSSTQEARRSEEQQKGHPC